MYASYSTTLKAFTLKNFFIYGMYFVFKLHTLDAITRFLFPQGQITASHSCSKSAGFSTSHSEYIICKKNQWQVDFM